MIVHMLISMVVHILITKYLHILKVVVYTHLVVASMFSYVGRSLHSVDEDVEDGASVAVPDEFHSNLEVQWP